MATVGVVGAAVGCIEGSADGKEVGAVVSLFFWKRWSFWTKDVLPASLSPVSRMRYSGMIDIGSSLIVIVMVDTALARAWLGLLVDGSELVMGL